MRTMHTVIVIWLNHFLAHFLGGNSITQVVDLLEGLRCLHLPLLCERIMEVPVRDWLVAAALQKDGAFCHRKSPLPEDDRTERADAPDEARAGGSRRILAALQQGFQ